MQRDVVETYIPGIYQPPGSGVCNPAGTILMGADRFQYDLASGEFDYEQFPLQTHYGLSIAWHPDGEVFAINDVNGAVTIWDFDPTRRIVELEGGMSDMESILAVEDTDSLAWSPDGSM